MMSNNKKLENMEKMELKEKNNSCLSINFHIDTSLIFDGRNHPVNNKDSIGKEWLRSPC